MDRKKTPVDIETAVLLKSARRCTLCFYLSCDLAEKMGQIAHLDKNPSNSAEDNLAFMCFDHHSVFDSKASQHKNYTLQEVKAARSKLYEAIAGNRHRETAASMAATYNLSGPNARLNINSLDHSTNAATLGPAGTPPDILMNENRARLLVTLPPDASEKISTFVPSRTMLSILYIFPMVHNHGKTVASITLSKAKFLILPAGKQLPTDPDYEAVDFQTSNAAIQLPQDASVIRFLQLGISNFDFLPVYEQQSALWLYGLIDYRDIYNMPHQSRFCFAYHVPGGFNPNPAGFYQAGSEAYNRCT